MTIFYRILFRLFPRRQWGKFWCDKHWAVIERDKEIDAAVAALGVVIALHEVGMSGGAESCCKVPEDLLFGIFERSTGWVKT